MNKSAIFFAAIFFLIAMPAAHATISDPGPMVGVRMLEHKTTEAIFVAPGAQSASIKIEGLAEEQHTWTKKLKVIPWRKTTYWYKVENHAELHPWPKKLPVKDLRSYAEIHPMKHWVIETFDRWHPVINSVGALGIPLLQVLKKNDGGL